MARFPHFMDDSFGPLFASLLGRPITMPYVIHIYLFFLSWSFEKCVLPLQLRQHRYLSHCFVLPVYKESLVIFSLLLAFVAANTFFFVVLSGHIGSNQSEGKF